MNIMNKAMTCHLKDHIIVFVDIEIKDDEGESQQFLTVVYTCIDFPQATNSLQVKFEEF